MEIRNVQGNMNDHSVTVTLKCKSGDSPGVPGVPGVPGAPGGCEQIVSSAYHAAAALVPARL